MLSGNNNVKTTNRLFSPIARTVHHTKWSNPSSGGGCECSHTSPTTTSPTTPNSNRSVSILYLNVFWHHSYINFCYNHLNYSNRTASIWYYFQFTCVVEMWYHMSDITGWAQVEYNEQMFQFCLWWVQGNCWFNSLHKSLSASPFSWHVIITSNHLFTVSTTRTTTLLSFTYSS